MFPKLHRQMAFFCTLVTGGIFLLLSLVCFSFAQNSIRQNGYASFLKEQATLLSNLQSQDVISHQWLNQMQEDHHLSIHLYDNGRPLHYQLLQQQSGYGKRQETLVSLALATAKNTRGLDIFQASSSLLTLHEEFSLTSEEGTRYYASVGVLPRNSGQLGFVILYSLQDQTSQLRWFLILILLADAMAILLLFSFSWLFTGHILKPLEENRQRQSQFIASASHELRSPLSVILSGVESMEKADTLAQSHHFLSLIRSEGKRMQHLISDMLLLAGSDSHTLCLHPKPCQPDELLLQSYEIHQALAQKQQVSLRLLLPEQDLPDCFWDPERIRQLLSVFLDNALSYTPPGREILLFLLPFVPNPKGSPKKNSLLFGVADQGPGIPDAEKQLIFQRFYRSQSSRTDKEHFGLGLCIAKEITTAHHGEIWAEDTPVLLSRILADPCYETLPDFCHQKTGGCTFLVKLPVHPTI